RPGRAWLHACRRQRSLTCRSALWCARSDCRQSFCSLMQGAVARVLATVDHRSSAPAPYIEYRRNTMMHKAKQLTALRKMALGMALASALSCVPAVQAQTVTAVMQSGLRVMDPVISTAFMTRDHGYMIYDTLLGTDANFKIQPQMADWKESADGKTYTFTLREGL